MHVLHRDSKTFGFATIPSAAGEVKYFVDPARTSESLPARSLQFVYHISYKLPPGTSASVPLTDVRANAPVIKVGRGPALQRGDHLGSPTNMAPISIA